MTIFAENNTVIMSFSARIKDLCKEKGILLKDLAKRLGISDVGLSQSINQKYPQLQTLERIANALEVEVVDLFPPSSLGGHKCPHCGKPISITIE